MSELETQPSPVAVEPKKKRRRQPRFILFAIGAIVVLGAGFAVWQTLFGGEKDATAVASQSKVVPVVKADREDLKTDATLQAEFVPYQDIAVHAKVSGYVNKIKVDIGDRVKQGDLLATLEIPELQDNINKAKASVSATEQEIAKAQADYDNQHQIDQRLADVAKAHPNMVAQQDLDTAKSKEVAAQGALGAAQQHRDEAQAELGRLNTLAAYEKITAPFDGIITERFADVGSLIQAGTNSNTQALPLVQLAQDDLLRLRFPVPEAQTPLIENGKKVEVTVPALSRTFAGTVTRYAWLINRSTRTMTTEVDVENPQGVIKAGMYAYVKLPLQIASQALAVPLQALTVGDDPTVFVLTKEGRLQERNVKVGLRTPYKAQILGGLEEGDVVVVGNRAGLVAGEKVEPKFVELPKVKLAQEN
ncbi:MAG: efflux RND transporter periplasmic adaptor subunit [Verrucomicrobia bacterium]|nr:efflux RND transporter periplasmic adaptor subunit [Verrucomicrobiota bacterium]